ncbi:MAG: DUF11 domain-containing protein [Micrococcales bacterium]|nr:DUF11 domain-containing protein [Micrococcales bacterium]MCL2667555.1 DUF11 domain-containing protein [Micrococcales bacterium]
MNKLVAPAASATAGVLVVGAALFTGTVGAKWSEAAPLDMGIIDVTVMIPEDPASFDLRAALSANRTVVPGLGTVPDVFPVSVEYAASATNLGPDDATNVTVAMDVPIVAGLDVTGVKPDPALVCDTSQMSSPQVGDPNHGLLVCTADGPLAPDASYDVVVTMTAAAPVSPPQIMATATVSSPGETGPTDNNTASWLLSSPNVLIDLSLHKAGPATIEAGKMGLYTLTVTNEPIGSEYSVADPPTVVDVLPDGVTFLSNVVVGSYSPSWCTAEGQTVTCDFAAPGAPRTIATGKSVSIPLSVQFDESLAGTTVVNTATVHNAATNVDPDPSEANNTWTATTVVTSGSGNEKVVYCPEGEVYDMFAGGCITPTPGEEGTPGGSIFDPTQPPPWNPFVVVTPGTPSPTTMTITAPFQPSDDHAILTIYMGEAWKQFVDAAAPNALGHTNAVDKNSGAKMWDAALCFGTVTMGGGSTFTCNGSLIPMDASGVGQVVVPNLNGTMSFPITVVVTRMTGAGNDTTVILPTWMMADLHVFDSEDNETWFAQGGTRVPGYTKALTYVPTEPTDWWSTDGYPVIPDPEAEPEPEPQQMGPAKAPLSLEGSGDGGTDEPTNLVEAVFDRDAMTLTLADGTVLTILRVDETDNGLFVLLAEDATEFAQTADDEHLWFRTTIVVCDVA